MTFHIYPAWGSEAESETHIFFENGKQQKHTALPATVQFLLKREMWTPMLLMKGKVKGTGKIYSDPTMRMVLLCLCSFKQGPHLPLWKKDSKCWIPPPRRAGSARLPTLILLSLTLWNSRAAWPQQAHTSPPTQLLPCVEQHANSPEECKIYQ